ncbi:hypothetical protein FM113_03400 [Leucobacter sp. 7(1)]|nr:hypothetical protein FM113_03400 [Leucobacter sp. 7(1)]
MKSFIPSGRIFPDRTNASAFFTLTALHTLVGFRGVKRTR